MVDNEQPEHAKFGGVSDALYIVNATREGGQGEDTSSVRVSHKLFNDVRPISLITGQIDLPKRVPAATYAFAWDEQSLLDPIGDAIPEWIGLFEEVVSFRYTPLPASNHIPKTDKYLDDRRSAHWKSIVEGGGDSGPGRGGPGGGGPGGSAGGTYNITINAPAGYPQTPIEYIGLAEMADQGVAMATVGAAQGAHTKYFDTLTGVYTGSHEGRQARLEMVQDIIEREQH